MKPWLGRYAEAMKALGYAPSTVRSHLEALRHFERFLDGRDPLRVTPGMLEEFRLEISRASTPEGLPRRPTTLNNILSAVKSFYRVLCDLDLIAYDPARKLVLVRVPERLPPPVLSADDMGKLLDSIDPTLPLGGRDRAAFEMLYSTGARVGELCAMDVGDVDLDERFARIRGKGGKERVVPFGSGARGHLENYLRWVRPGFAGRTSRLWLDAGGAPLRAYTVRRRLRRYIREAGISGKLTPHGVRHACATHLVLGHADLRHIQELLGHASIETTQIYTHLDVRHLRETLARCHPREGGEAITDGDTG